MLSPFSSKTGSNLLASSVNNFCSSCSFKSSTFPAANKSSFLTNKCTKPIHIASKGGSKKTGSSEWHQCYEFPLVHGQCWLHQVKPVKACSNYQQRLSYVGQESTWNNTGKESRINRVRVCMLMLQLLTEWHEKILDIRLWPQCRHLANFTKQRCPMSDWCKHLANSIKQNTGLDFGPMVTL